MPNKEQVKLLQDVGRRIAEIRAQKGWRQQDLADSLRVTWRQIAWWEAGWSNFTVLTLDKLSKSLGCKLEDFLKKPKTSKSGPGRPAKKKSHKN